jgi:ABC-type ATPase involved in cell division
MDPKARSALVQLIATLRDAGSAIVLATHDAALREAVADRVIDVDGGRVTPRSRQAATA